MTPEQIEEIGKLKVLDYIEDIIINLAISAANDPEKLIKKIESDAFVQCNYDDPTIDRVIYQQLQDAIKRNLKNVFNSINKKVESKFEDF